MESNKEIKIAMIPESRLEQIERDLYQIKRSIDTTESLSKPSKKEWLPKLEFQELVSIKNTRFHELIVTDKIPKRLIRRVGRKLYVHKDVVEMYFEGGL